jgi:hypothetical protein
MKKNIFLLFILCLFMAKARAQTYYNACNPISVCVGDTVTDSCMLYCTNTLIGGVWSSSNAAIATGTAGSVTGISSGTANITYTWSHPVIGVHVLIFDVTVLAPPSAAPSYPTVCEGGTLSLSANDAGGNTYAWSGPDGFSSTAQNPSIDDVTSAISGTYTLVVTSAAGCSATYTVDVALCSSEFAVAGVVMLRAGALQFTPNPASGSVTISLAGIPDGAVDVRVVNATGAEVYRGTHTFGNGHTVLDLKSLPDGMYMIQLADGKGVIKTGKMLIAK